MTAGEMVIRTLIRLGDDPDAAQPNQFYTPSEVLAWINTAQRVFCLLTLWLESTATFALATDGTAFYSMLNDFAYWLLPLRVRVTGGGKLRPSRLQDLAALDSAWSTTRGTPTRYCLRGFDLLATYPQPTVSTSLDVTFARSPLVLVSDSDTPELPAEFHPALIDGAIVLCRAKEGAQEFAKVQPLWNRYLDEAQRLGDLVRHRSKERGYDRLPVEIAKMDRSRMFMEVAGK